MKTSNRANFFVAPFTAVVLALGGALFLPAFGIPGANAAADSAAAGKERPCITEKGSDPKACSELVELEVKDVVPLMEAQTHAVVLTTKDGETVLPLFVDEGAAVSIAFRLAERPPPQPLSQDLLDDVVNKLGGKVTEVRIDDLRDNVYSGRVFLQQGKKELALDARPSDSIAMAMHSQARIRVTRKVLAMAGITRSEIEALQKQQDLGVGGSGGLGEEDMGPLPPPPPMGPSAGQPKPHSEDIGMDHSTRPLMEPMGKGQEINL
ncbi:bifunctional nuclease family protein [Corallococcus sp. AB038B]|uniref:bifunctional nuclease family protein n=1 Tax=Corallococcus sp. AB038B TaxID=2316718 RepID=UPI0018F74DF7|nr:bifunctional nuclease family protein [Corallococcus sp. AB038B]